jgi:UDP-glucose 4-epimerase
VTAAPLGELSGRRVLVTGGSGFIGRHVVAALSRAGAQPRVVDLVAHPDPSVEIVRGDIAQRSVVDAAVEGVSAIVHLAAVTSVLGSLRDPEGTYRTNVAGTHTVLEAAREAGVQSLAFASTNAVVGEIEGGLIDESAIPRPLTPYGATKAAAEMLMSAYSAAFGVRCACLRLTNVYGLGMQAKDSIIARLMRAIRLGQGFEIYGDGEQVRDYVNVSDVSEAMLGALVNEDWQGPIVIGTGTSLSVLEVVEAVRRVSGADFEVRHGPAKPGEMRAVVVDNSRARAAGWTPQFDLAGGLVGVWDEWSRADVEAPVPGGR